MKKSLLSILFLFLFAYSAANAQFESFLAKQGLEKAIAAAAADGITNPELLLVMSMKRTITVTNPLDQSDLDIEVQFNIDDGTSNVWLYLFRSADDHEMKATIGVVKVMIVGLYAQKISDFEFEIPVLGSDFDETLNGVNWIESDQMAGIFKQESSLMDFIDANPNPETEVVALSMNPEFPFISEEMPAWYYAILANDDSHICVLNNNNQSVVCQDDFLGVEEVLGSDDIGIAPNPANDFIGLDIPESYNKINANVSIFDAYGREVYSAELKSKRIDASAFSPGMYVIRINNGSQIMSSRFIKK